MDLYLLFPLTCLNDVLGGGPLPHLTVNNPLFVQRVDMSELVATRPAVSPSLLPCSALY